MASQHRPALQSPQLYDPAAPCLGIEKIATDRIAYRHSALPHALLGVTARQLNRTRPSRGRETHQQLAQTHGMEHTDQLYVKTARIRKTVYEEILRTDIVDPYSRAGYAAFGHYPLDRTA